jgi:transmembrane sensor
LQSFWALRTRKGDFGWAHVADERQIVTIPIPTSDPDPPFDEALDWVVRLKTGEPTKADIEALQRWRRQSPAHEEAFKNAARLFRNAGIAARELADEQGASAPVPGLRRSSSRVLARRALLGGAIAASAAGYLVVRPPLGLWPSLEELSADYRTGKGEHRKVVVAPDVSLELNTQTSVALRSAQNETQIELISGEASVAAKRSSSTPLVVLAGAGRITALQANFNARCLDGVVSVTCLDGAVDVEQGRNRVRLRKAEQVSYSGAGIEASVPVDVAQVTAWQAGLLIFRDMPLASVVDEVNRYRPGKIIIANADLRRRLVNGTFQVDRLENFVAQVEQLFGARVRSLPGGVVILS